jgi:hypothetical protein
MSCRRSAAVVRASPDAEIASVNRAWHHARQHAALHRGVVQDESVIPVRQLPGPGRPMPPRARSVLAVYLSWRYAAGLATSA